METLIFYLIGYLISYILWTGVALMFSGNTDRWKDAKIQITCVSLCSWASALIAAGVFIAVWLLALTLIIYDKYTQYKQK